MVPAPLKPPATVMKGHGVPAVSPVPPVVDGGEDT